MENVNVYCSGGEAFEYYSPFFLIAPTRFDSIGTKAVYASGAKGGLEKAQSCRGEVRHFRYLWIFSPFLALRTLSLQTLDGLSSTKDLVFTAEFSEHPLRTGMTEFRIITLDDQFSNGVPWIQYDRVHVVRFQVGTMS